MVCSITRRYMCQIAKEWQSLERGQLLEASQATMFIRTCGKLLFPNSSSILWCIVSILVSCLLLCTALTAVFASSISSCTKDNPDGGLVGKVDGFFFEK